MSGQSLEVEVQRQRLKIKGKILEGHVDVSGQGQHVAQVGETS